MTRASTGSAWPPNLASHGTTTATAWDLSSLLAEVDQVVPDAILLNIDTPDSATLLQLALDLDRRVRVIVYGLSSDRESEIVSCAEAGVAGLHLRTESFDHLLSLTTSSADGRAQCSAEVSSILIRRVYAFAAQANPDTTTDVLTRRKIEILELIEQGLTNQQIASRLSLTPCIPSRITCTICSASWRVITRRGRRRVQGDEVCQPVN